MKEAGDPAAPERWASLRMWMHIEQKGFQLGSILGVATSIVATPLNRYYLKKTSPPVNIITGRGAVLGLGFASATPFRLDSFAPNATKCSPERKSTAHFSPLTRKDAQPSFSLTELRPWPRTPSTL